MLVLYLRRGTPEELTKAYVWTSCWLPLLCIGFAVFFNAMGVMYEPFTSDTRCLEDNEIATCFVPSLELCPEKAKRRAIVVAYDFFGPLILEENHGGSHQTTREFMHSQARAARYHGADYVLVMPEGVIIPGDTLKELVDDMGMIFYKVPWILPPNLSEAIPVDSGGCCGAREFMKLHVFNMTAYDAIVFYDTDVLLSESNNTQWPEGVITPLFDCAASGKFLSTSCSRHFPWVNGGFFAARPHHDLFLAMLDELSRATVSKWTGWNDFGWGPKNFGTSASQFRMQGFLTYFFYQGKHQKYLTAKQVDGCIWNRQKWHTLEECNDGDEAICRQETRVFHHSG
eukprot:CAMPEP_0178450084 /NCGR_PEP_ID=MMETSP0689_2-20121128/42918_1 /TAXON_ID=160604 /ORGANISM="Amphidinium massartii, Strain CS-259" /LENGTH=341 /DNA_ID=CAMNT_0020075491 /DNA_START=139 /DNA_END=1160 /DNA_ORIENTATION=+